MSTTNTTPEVAAPAQVDVRGPRFAAWITTVVLLAVLVLSAISPAGATILLAVQAVVFAIGALRGPRQHPYGLIFANFVAPRLSPVTEREPVPPLQFAQLVGAGAPSLVEAHFFVGRAVFGVPVAGAPVHAGLAVFV